MISAWRRASVLLAMLVPAAAGDVLVVRGEGRFVGVRVIACEQGRVAFLGASRRAVRVAIGQLESIELDAWPTFTAAEQVRDSRPQRAVAALEQLLRDPGTPRWLRRLATHRLIGPLERCGRFDEAVRRYVALWRVDPRGAGQMRLTRPAPPGSAALAGARRIVRAALAGRLPPQARAALRRLWLELRLIDGLRPPPGLAPPAPQDTVPRAATGADAPPLLFAGASVEQTAPGAEGVVALGADSIVLEAVRQALARQVCDQARRLLWAARPWLTPAARDSWRLLEARARSVCDDPADGATELEALAATTSDSRLAAEALWHAARAWQRLGRCDLAATLYRRLAGHPGADAALRRRAAQALRTLQRRMQTP